MPYEYEYSRRHTLSIRLLLHMQHVGIRKRKGIWMNVVILCYEEMGA